MRDIVKFAVILMFVAGLSGCKTLAVYFGNELNAEHPFDEKSDEAVVVMGLVLAHASDHVGMLMTTENWRVVWRRIEEAGPAKDGAIIAVRRHCAVFASKKRVPCEPDHQKVMRNAFVVPPGEYMLSSVTRSQVSTQFLGSGDSLFSKADVERKKAKNKVPWFTVRAGEVAYVGDFVFDIQGDKARMLDIRYDEVGARETMALFPEVSGTVALRKLSGGTEFTKLSPPPQELDPSLTAFEVVGESPKSRKIAELLALRNLVLKVRERQHRMFRILDVKARKRTTSSYGTVLSATWSVTMEAVSATEEEAERIGGKWRRVAEKG